MKKFLFCLAIALFVGISMGAIYGGTARPAPTASQPSFKSLNEVLREQKSEAPNFVRCEEDMPCWDCKTMGNKQCAPVKVSAPAPKPAKRVTVAPAPATVAPAPVRCEEDQPCWDCKTMGNRVCGTVAAPAPYVAPAPVKVAPAPAPAIVKPAPVKVAPAPVKAPAPLDCTPRKGIAWPVGCKAPSQWVDQAPVGLTPSQIEFCKHPYLGGAWAGAAETCKLAGY